MTHFLDKIILNINISLILQTGKTDWVKYKNWGEAKSCWSRTVRKKKTFEYWTATKKKSFETSLHTSSSSPTTIRWLSQLSCTLFHSFHSNSNHTVTALKPVLNQSSFVSLRNLVTLSLNFDQNAKRKKIAKMRIKKKKKRAIIINRTFTHLCKDERKIILQLIRLSPSKGVKVKLGTKLSHYQYPYCCYLKPKFD